MTERYRELCQVLQRCVVSILCFTTLLGISHVSAADMQCIAGTSRYRSFNLAHVSPKRAKELLDRLKLGTVSQLPSTDMLLVTGEPDEVQKATAILDVVDVTEPYEIKELRSADSPDALSANDQIAAAVGNIHIGTFKHPPLQGSKARALLDVHNGVLWAIAPAQRLKDIVSAVELGPEALALRKATSDRITDGAMIRALQADAMLESRFAASAGQAKINPAFNNQVLPAKVADTQPRAADGPTSAFGSPAGVTALSEEAPPGQVDENDVTSPTMGTIHVVPDTTSEEGIQVSTEPNSDETAHLEPGQVVPETQDQEAAMPAEPSAETAGTMASPAASDQYTAPASEPNGDYVIENITLPERLPVIQLLDLVGKYLKLDYIYDPDKITGDVTLKLNGNLRGSMRVKDLYLLLESVLKFKGLVMTRHSGNVVTIARKEEAMDIDPRLVGSDSEEIAAGNAVVTRVFKLEYIDTDSAKNLFDSMKLSLDVTPIPETGTIIVTAYTHRMARVEQLLSIVDRPGEPRDWEFLPLRYTMAKSLVEKVKAAAEQLEGLSVTVGASEPELSIPRIPNESEANYQARLARLRAARAVRSTTTASQPEQKSSSKPGVYLDADERTNRILMIGVRDQLEAVRKLVSALDVQKQDLRTLKLYRIEHVDAQEVPRKLQELGIISRVPESATSSRITSTSIATSQRQAAPDPRIVAAEQAARAAAGLPTSTEPTEQGPVEEPQVVVVESTNSLLVNATDEQHEQIGEIIRYVDSEMLATEIPYKIYPLENSSPDHLATVLQSLIQETVQGQDQEGKIQTTVIKKDEEIKFVPDPNTYSLIVYANKKNQEWISSLIKQLDKRRPQVLIDVTLVEITKSDAFNYDLNLIQSVPDLTSTSGLTGTIVPGTTPVTSSDIMAKLANSDRSQFADMQFNHGNFTGFYGDKHVNALLTAMQTKNYGRVLARPKILVNDNEVGNIKTSRLKYVKKTSSVPRTSGTTGAQENYIETSVDYQEYEDGIELEIVPHISEGDLLQLQATLTRADFQPTEDTTKPPDKIESSLTSNVTVPDGSTIILGGMLKMNQTKGGSKVPLLGDLPLVGGLFRSINNTDDQSKLYVFIKAEIIRPATVAKEMEDIRLLSSRDREAFEASEQEFQDYQSWPGIKPDPVPPAKVLDAQ
jgi:general secretion pathway protein D